MSGAPGLMECEGLPGPIGERTLLGRPLAEWQADVLSAAPSDRLYAPADLAFSRTAVIAACRAGRALGRDATFFPGGRTCDPIAALAGPPTGLTWLAPGGDSDLAARARAAPVEALDPQEREIPGFSLPDGPLVVADAWMFPVRHWAQLLWANLLALGPHLWGELVGTGPIAGFRLLGATIRAGSVRPEDVAARLSVRGRGAQVHRSAVVEGVVLGPGARIGAGAVVRGCVLGAGAIIEELALVEGVVLGAGARVQRQAMAKYMVIEAGAAHGGVAQLGVVGRDAQVKMGATLMDMAFGQDVRLSVGGRLVPAPHRLCGVCVGPRAIIGSGVWVAPGRAVPADLAVVADADRVLRRVVVPPGTTRAVVRRGALEPDDALG